MMLQSSVAPCYSHHMTNTQTPTFSEAYRAEFLAIADSIDSITDQAVADQQSGIPSNRGRARYGVVAESSHYINAWIKSLTLNGPAR